MKLNILFLTLLFLLFAYETSAQDLKSERVLSLDMLENVKNDIQKNYYDSTFHGINLEENYLKTKELIKNAKSSNEMTDLIVRFCYLFNDSHLYFSPPRKTFDVDYGFGSMLIADKAFVTEVKDDSDAYKKGLRVGDQIYMIEGFIINRQEFSVILRHFFRLQPQPSLQLLIIKPNGNKYKLDVKGKVLEASKFMFSRRDREIEFQKFEEEHYSPRFYTQISGLAIIKMPSFNISLIKVNKMMEKVNEKDSLILDLRGNHGGYTETLTHLLGYFFDKDVDGGKTIERDGTRQWVIKPSVKKPFKGKLVVLIDSGSASAAEIFTRIIQLEKRGTVIGDQSSGAVMQSIILSHSFGLESYVFYGVSVTIADLIMKDGQRLENVGVTPDEKLLPTSNDLIKNQDPILSRAAEVLGFKISSEEAGLLFKTDK